MDKQHDVQVPIEACRFAADFKTSQPGEDKTVPFTAVARTAKPVSHWYWGEACVHDFSGMEAADSCIVDWEHYGEILGFANKRVIDAEGLSLSGFLTPFKADDMATEVAHKARLGVPYQASIDFDEREIVVEDVPAGFSTTVNGDTFHGPLTVFRKWKLRSLGICKNGVDGNTSVKFSAEKLSGKTVSVTRFSKGQSMEVKPQTTPAAEATNATPAPVPTPAAGAAAEVSVVAPAGTTQLSRKEEGKLFTDTFGPVHGPTLFAAGHSLQEAHTEFAKITRTEIDRLSGELAKKNAPPAGGATPASFSSAETPAKPGTPAKGKWSNLPDSLAKVAGGIKIPGRAS